MTHNGWRKPTPGLVEAEKHARAGEKLSVPKSQAIVAAKKVAAAIGLKAQDLLLLDTFGAVTQKQDWEQGKRPIVWVSNNFLMEQTGFSLPTLRRHIRRLCEAGIIWMKDSPNGKRWGRRNEEGYITEAYGFDLAPLAARTAEFEALYAHLQEERQFCASLRNTITVTRRVIRAKIEKALESALRGPWKDLQEEYVMVIQGLPSRAVATDRLLDYVDIIKEFKVRVEDAFEAAFDWPAESDAKPSNQESKTSSNVVSFNNKDTPTSLKNDTHLLTTNQPKSVSSNSFEKKHVANIEPDHSITDQVDGNEKVDMDINWSTHGQKRGSEVDIPMLMIACPEFAQMARALGGTYLRDWNDVHRAAAKMRGIVGISEDAWNVANQIMGPAKAAAAIALIYDKQSEGLVQSAGGYLRALVQRAKAGDLHLDRSFFGRLSETRAH
ncbi:plasmid replication protein RepC [Ahrensia sp. 13_GOM-1096m]|uniref:plasmid replication protein RepC n=1 Tax=Ahrensia sp. 13_GOM-1096m TaxID=1380380 RepID=UPI00047DFABD|nr:plasmid replication protein RepC [Ahrensia sp. 13_GOM-1096m]